MQKENVDTWYSSWFDTPYYHILYKDRDHEEADSFMKRLASFLKLKEDDTILDLACGKGRHAMSLSKMGYNVTGVDLSEASITYAKQFETDNLHFAVHDMCLPLPTKFSAVFNLFTSFGYFEAEEDNLRTLKAIKQELKTMGHGVIDFMNVPNVITHLVPSETKVINNITFHIERYVKDGHIVKKISFKDKETSYTFQERVRAITLADFKKYFELAGLELLHCFGDYSLTPFMEDSSERLILIFR